MKPELKEKIEIKKWEIKNWCYDQSCKAKRFWNENRDYIIVIVPLAVATGEKLIKCINRNARLHEERDLKERYIYDMSLKCYYEMKRKPTPKEYLEIDRRKKNGESLGAILNSMRLLK